MFNSEFISSTFPDLLMEFINRVRAIVSTGNLYPQAREPIPQRMVEPQSRIVEMESTMSAEFDLLMPDNPAPWFIKLVEEGLRKYSDVIVLGQSPLAEYVGLKHESQIARGRQIQKLLNDAIEALRPAGPRPMEPLPRDWTNYIVLHDAYVKDIPNRNVMARLYISEGTFNRTRRNALRGVAIFLIEGVKQRRHAN